MALLVAALATAYGETARASAHTIDLRDGADVVVVGAADHDAAGFVSNAGDVNGDGVPDVLVSSCEWPHQRTRSGATFVVFGRLGEQREVRLDGSDDHQGFQIRGASPGDRACEAEGVGDVNGDGLDDIAIGATGADNRGRTDSGSAYVVFGKASSSPIGLSSYDLGLAAGLGFRIDGPASVAFAGASVAGIGDMNADGLDDMLVGAPWAGSSYVVYGKDTADAVDLATFHSPGRTAGIRISHPAPDSAELFSVASAGDMNRDGIPDIAIGLAPTDRSAGVSYVVYGRRFHRDVDVRRLGKRGYRIFGARARDEAGRALAPAGDVNGDGFDDLIVGAPQQYAGDRRGNAYVVFGSGGARDLNLGDLRRRGFRMRGIQIGDSAGLSVAGPGDVNGDGLDDLLVGAPGAAFVNRGSRQYLDWPGAAFVVFGKDSTAKVRLGALGGRGYRVKGANAAPDQCEEDISHPQTGPIISHSCGGDLAGASVAAAGDVNDDGLADLLVGAPLGGDPSPGHSYIIWSHPFLP